MNLLVDNTKNGFLQQSSENIRSTPKIYVTYASSKGLSLANIKHRKVQ